MNAQPLHLNSSDTRCAGQGLKARERCPLAPLKVQPILAACCVWLTPAIANAYIGPGAGLSALGSLLALLGAALLTIVGFVWYPVKRMLRKWRATHAAEDDQEDESPATE